MYRSLLTWNKVCLFTTLVFSVFNYAYSDTPIELSKRVISVQLNNNETINITVNKTANLNGILKFYPVHDDIVEIKPPQVQITPNGLSYLIDVIGRAPGHSDVTANLTQTKENVDVEDLFLKVTVFKNGALKVFSTTIGWIYFVAWSVSFYPQIYINWKRKSVVGLNFDFLLLNINGFTLYSIFNLGLYYIPAIQEEYKIKFPRSLNPVLPNDIFFSVHAMIATLFTISQCFIYERGDQRVSLTARGIIGVFGAFLLISMILCFANVLLWLDFLYFCSYVKLAITLIKYVPQAYMNYKRKSTIGWSIGNIFLDFTGGMLSMLQMIINAYNYDDWISIFGDPTKFGLGLFSVVFDIFFIIQHYVLYRYTNYEINTSTSTSS